MSQINKAYIQLVVEGKVDRKRLRERSQMRWTDKLKEVTVHSVHAQNTCNKYKQYINNISTPSQGYKDLEGGA